MKIIKDIKQRAKEIKACLAASGSLAQHQYSLFLNYSEEPVFFDWGENQGVMAYQKKTIGEF